MALTDLDITRRWPDKSHTNELNWDAIKIPLDEFSDFTNRNLEQLARDCLGEDYEFDNDGNANNAGTLVDVMAFPDEDEHVTGSWIFDVIADLGVVDTADINGGNIDETPIGVASSSTGKFNPLNVSTTTRYLSISPAALFTPLGSNNANKNHSFSYFLYNAEPSFLSNEFVAPIHLPHGSILTRARFYLSLLDVLASIGYQIRKYSTTGALTQIYAGASTGWDGGNFYVDSPALSETIDNQNYSYVLYFAIDNNNNAFESIVKGTNLTYTVTSTYS